MTVSDKDRVVLTEFADACTSMVEALDVVEHRARLFCAINPLGFFVWTGGTLPAYLSMLDTQRNKLRHTIAQVNERMRTTDGRD